MKKVEQEEKDSLYRFSLNGLKSSLSLRLTLLDSTKKTYEVEKSIIESHIELIDYCLETFDIIQRYDGDIEKFGQEMLGSVQKGASSFSLKNF